MKDDDAGASATRSLQERLEAPGAGRVAIMMLMVVTVVSLAVWNMPNSALQRAGLRVARPYVMLVGLDQNWKVFSPNPRTTSFDLYASVTLADGEVRRWVVPAEAGPFLAPYRSYRWSKWLESVRLDNQSAVLWEPAAMWIASEQVEDGREPVTIELVRRWFDTPAPGSGSTQPPWNDFVYYRYDVATGTGENLT